MKHRSWLILTVLIFGLFFLAAPPNVTQAAPLSQAKDIRQIHLVRSAPLEDVSHLAAGGNHTCVVTNQGAVKCWGMNWYGQLGDGTEINRAAPVQVFNLESGVSKVAVGANHTCAVTDTGGVKCWGENRNGELGMGNTLNSPLPVDVIGLGTGVSAVAAGSGHTCALMQTGGVKCWGANWTGQLGNNSSMSSSVPVDVSGLSSGVTAISANGFHTCALLVGGSLKCWGFNSNGQLGNNSTTSSPVPVNVTDLGSGVTAIATGYSHSCAVASGGAVKCWGGNWTGQLGDGTDQEKFTPVDVAGLTSGYSAVIAGMNHTCALSTTGVVKCWGENLSGQLGDGTTVARSTPVNVSGLGSGVAALAGGNNHTCARMNDGTVNCWGANGFAQGGFGVNIQEAVPKMIETLSGGVNSLAAGYYHTCVVTTAGGVKCWGNNEKGQLGDGSTINRYSPVDVSGLPGNIKAVTAGMDHTCALTTGGEVKCWGNNNYGQLGNGSTSPSTTPVNVTSLGSGVKAIAAGEAHTCAVTSTGGLKCWGGNWAGQLGNGAAANSPQPNPVNVSGLSSGVANVVAGSDHTCALTTGGGLKCWGDNYFGQVGDNTFIERYSPVDVVGLASGVTSVAAGVNHTCAVASGGEVKCWGSNRYGQGGNEVFETGLPTQVTDAASGYLAVGAGGLHTCGITTSGQARCWGYNRYGQLGKGVMYNLPSPENVTGLQAGVTKIANGHDHTCAEVSGKIFCWGENGSGQLGRPVPVTQKTPRQVVAFNLTGEVVPPAGYPGTVFRVSGGGFPGELDLGIRVNGQELQENIETKESGDFVFFLDSTGAAPGSYTLEIYPTGTGSQDMGFTLALFVGAGWPGESPVGGGLTLALPVVPAGDIHFLFLPLATR